MEDREVHFDGLAGVYGEVIGRFRRLIPDLDDERSRFPRLFLHLTGRLHGIAHWTRVGIHGLAIARALRGQGKVVTPCLAAPAGLEEAVILAAFFHDCARTGDGNEPEHGREGEKVWRHYSMRKGLARDLSAEVSQAILFHVDHTPVDPEAREAAVCLSNADRLDRVRLGERPDPLRMYEDGIWPELSRLADRLLEEVSLARVRSDLGI